MSIRAIYASQGVNNFYRNQGSFYSNPHEQQIANCLAACKVNFNLPLNSVLDLACGSGEVTRHLKATNTTGIDPFTNEAYFNKTGKQALKFSFEEIAQGAIQSHSYSLIVISYALHLLEESRLPDLCWALASISDKLLILSPNKKPDIRWAWNLEGEIYVDRVRAKFYKK